MEEGGMEQPCGREEGRHGGKGGSHHHHRRRRVLLLY